MGTRKIAWVAGALAVALWLGCSDDDSGADKQQDSGGGALDRGATPEPDQGGTPDTGGGAADTGGATDTGGTADGAGATSVGKACTNPDGNTHTDCTGDTNYCVPDVAGVEMAGLTKLTCTKKDCDPKDTASCPTGYSCMEIPAFVITMMKAQGINMPSMICGKKKS